MTIDQHTLHRSAAQSIQTFIKRIKTRIFFETLARLSLLVPNDLAGILAIAHVWLQKDAQLLPSDMIWIPQTILD